MRSRLGAARLLVCAASLLAFVSLAPMAGGQEPAAGAPSDLSGTARKLANPLSDVWALFARFDASYSDGQVNLGDPRVGSKMIFQPILPLPLYGNGAKRWNLMTRPTIPVLFTASIPTGLNTFDRKAGLGDIQLPTVIAPPTAPWILGAGPAFLFPTASDDFGRNQWGIGPAVIVGYANERATVATLVQYYFGTGWKGERPPGAPDASYMNLLYVFFLNLPDAWQVGFSPTITYDKRASDGNKWNVPVGMMAAKTTLIGKLPIKFSLGVEYSVVTQDVYGERGKLVLEVVPVIPNLITRSILGGN